jgi:aspartate/methionine/tyrosine aminotransferase
LADDPYYYLYYGKEPRYPSYFALERTELPQVGRVLRFDSFSKILSAGMRIGFASGPEALLKSIDMDVSPTLVFGSFFVLYPENCARGALCALATYVM